MVLMSHQAPGTLQGLLFLKCRARFRLFQVQQPLLWFLEMISWKRITGVMLVSGGGVWSRMQHRLVWSCLSTALLPSPTRSNVFQHFAAPPRYCLSQDPTFCNVLWSCLATPLIPIPTDLTFCSILWPCLGTASHGCPGGCLGTTLVSLQYRLPQDPTFCSILWSRLGIASRRVPRFQHSVVPPRYRLQRVPEDLTFCSTLWSVVGTSSHKTSHIHILCGLLRYCLSVASHNLFP